MNDRGLDKDKKIRAMDDLINTNQKHIEHLKSTIHSIKERLAFEQKRNQELEKDNQSLKEQVKKLQQQQQQYQSSNQCTPLMQGRSIEQQLNPTPILPKRDDPKPMNNAIKNLQIKQFVIDELPTVEPPISVDPKKVIKPPLKLDIQSALKKGQTLGPMSCVKKSVNYLKWLTDEKLIESSKELAIVRLDKNFKKQLIKSLIPELKNKPCLFNFSLSTIFDRNTYGNDQTDISEFMREARQIHTIQEEVKGEMEISIVQPQAVKLFEKFYIMGCNKSEFQEFDNDGTVKEGILPASIMFKSEPTQTESYENIIHEFAYPFGNQVEKIKLNDSFRKLKEIIFSGNKYELMDKFFIFQIKNQESGAGAVEYSNQQLLNGCNAERNLYGICLSVYDYIETTPDNIALTIQNRRKRVFWRYKKTYCFLTYFPFFELFQDLLIAVINLIKFNRTDRFVRKNTDEYEVLKEVDGQQIINDLEGQLVEFLQSIQQVKPESFYQQLEFQTLAGTLKYKISNQLLMKNDLRLWSTTIALQVLTSRELILIFLAMTHEISIVFFSDKISVLTAVIHFFHHLLAPLQWISPIIYCVPENLLTIVDSPVPVIVGINLAETDIKEFDILDKGEQLMYVYLDRDSTQKIITKPMTLRSTFKEPHFGGFFSQLEQILRNPTIRNASPGMRPSMRIQDAPKKVIKFVFDDQDLNKSRQILDIFGKVVNEYMIKKLPTKNDQLFIKNDEMQLNMLLIEELHVQASELKDREFIGMLYQTQSFTFLLQEHYGAV